MVTISKALCQINGRIFVKGTKSGSVRTVPLGKMAVDALKRQRVRQAVERLRAGHYYEVDPAEPIFTNELGVSLTPQAATAALGKMARRAGLITSEVLGHASAGGMLNVYSHVLVGGKRDGIDRLDERLSRIVEKGFHSHSRRQPNGNRSQFHLR